LTHDFALPAHQDLHSGGGVVEVGAMVVAVVVAAVVAAVAAVVEEM